MSNQANIRDIQILDALKAGVGRFGEDVLQILASLQKQFEQIEEWLRERHDHWQEQVDTAQEEVYTSRQSLNKCESQYDDEEGNSPDCGYEEEQVAEAEKQLAECERNLETVKKWRHRIEGQIADFQNDIHQLSDLATARTGSAQAFLANKIEILSRYATGGVSSSLGISGLQGQSQNVRIRPGAELTSVEKQALRKYTESESDEINKALRKRLPDVVALRRAELISQALAKLPPYQGTVYRGINLDETEISNYVPGSIVTELQFSSASRDNTGAFKGNTRFTMFSNAAKDISSFSAYEAEKEVLFDQRSAFKVISREHVDGVWKIELQEL